MKVETRNCQNCKNSFTIEPEDFEFYAKIKAPPPTFCPDCRMQRRMAWRNERSLYKRKDVFGKDIISIYAPDGPFTVYPRDYWWSDKWDPLDYGREYDFTRPFFTQFRELLEAVPVASVFSNNVVDSPYTNHVGNLKDSYLTFATWECENVNYSDKAIQSKDSFDVYLATKCELCYWVVDSEDSYCLFFSSFSSGCSDSFFLFDCKNCQNCFGCVGLRNKQYCIFNEQYSKEDYEKKLKEINTGSFESIQKYSQLFNEFKLQRPHKYARLINAINTIGDNCRNMKNCKFAFDIAGVEDSQYVTHGGLGMKDSYDGYGVGICELLYEGIDSGVNGSREKFSVVVYGARDTDYCFNCEGGSNLFGCIGLRNKEYCILNKQYSKEDYLVLRTKIIEQMNQMPYIDSRGRKYAYGEFFPVELSPFAYNETIANEYYPMSKDDADKDKFHWRESEAREFNISMYAKNLPDHIQDVPDTIINEQLGCLTCTKAYRILQSELDFYKRQNLPLPRQCSECRHKKRFESRNPIKLWHRKCQCVGVKSQNGVYQNTVNHAHGNSSCSNEFETSYAPDRPEIVYCEACYNAEVA